MSWLGGKTCWLPISPGTHCPPSILLSRVQKPVVLCRSLPEFSAFLYPFGYWSIDLGWDDICLSCLHLLLIFQCAATKSIRKEALEAGFSFPAQIEEVSNGWKPSDSTAFTGFLLNFLPSLQKFFAPPVLQFPPQNTAERFLSRHFERRNFEKGILYWLFKVRWQDKKPSVPSQLIQI